MKVFVAGATGTLGLPLVRALVALKHQVTGLTRSSEKLSVLEQLGAAGAVADALDAAALEKVLRAAAPDCVFHLLTAIPKNKLLRTSHMKQTNRTTGTANLLKASIAAGAKRIVAESMVTLGAKPPFSIPQWLLRLMSPYMATVFGTRLVVSNRKAKDELHWRPQYPSYREGLREMATHL